MIFKICFGNQFYDKIGKSNIYRGFYFFVQYLLTVTLDFTYLTQVYEWFSMIYIIQSQHGKKVEEILYEIGQEKSHKKIKYRQIEKIILGVFVTIYLGKFCMYISMIVIL